MLKLGGLCVALMLASLQVSAQESDTRSDIEPKVCSNCAAWNAPREPFLVAANSWYVGPGGLAAVLIDTGSGLLLIDAGLPQSAAQIATHIRQLGFELAQLRWILNSHAHYDHAGGIAALQRWSGATVIASRRGAEALQAGDAPPEDPQAGFGAFNQFPKVAEVQVVADKQTFRLGQLSITAHYTPGHTPGGTTFTWPVCDAKGDCLDVVYVDSLSAVSTEDYRFLDHPPVIAALRASIARVAELPCDVAISTHPQAVDLFRRQAEDRLLDVDACRRLAQTAERGLSERLQREATDNAH